MHPERMKQCLGFRVDRSSGCAELTAWNAVGDLCCIVKLHSFLQKLQDAQETLEGQDQTPSQHTPDTQEHNNKVGA